MTLRDALRRVVGLLLRPWRMLNAVVTRTHANWVAVILAAVAIAVTIYLAGPAPTGPVPESETALTAGPDYEADIPPGPPLQEKNSETDLRGGNQSCDPDYALFKNSEFRELIEAEARQCVRNFDNPIELYYSCHVEDGVYAVSLKYQFSGTFNDERLAFSAEYRGPKDIDKTQVKVTSLTPVFQKLCREKAKATQR